MRCGRVVGSAGDRVLAEFARVADAVQCAVEIQQELKAKSAEFPPSRRMEFRIGINVSAGSPRRKLEANALGDLHERPRTALRQPRSGRDPRAVLPQVLGAQSGPRHGRAPSRLMVMVEETARVGVFPDRQTRARRAPGLDDRGLRPGVRTEPFPQVEDQSVDGVRHGHLLSVGSDGSRARAWVIACHLPRGR